MALQHEVAFVIMFIKESCIKFDLAKGAGVPKIKSGFDAMTKEVKRVGLLAKFKEESHICIV